MIELYTKAGKLLRLENLGKMTEEHQDFIAIQFQDYQEEDLEWVRSNFGIDLSIMNNTEDFEISSHFQENAHQSSFHISLPYYKQRDDVMAEESFFVILTATKVFAFSNSNLDDYLNEIYAHKFQSRKYTSLEVEDLFRFHIGFIADYYADITENIAKRIKQVASRVLVKKEFKDDDLDIITQLNFNNLLIKESINEFTRILTLQKKSLRESTFNVKDTIDEELNDLSVVSDYIQFNFDRLDDLKENISNKIELEQNKIFKLLTVVTFCISMPTLIAGIFGMNFKFMPELESRYGYPLALIAMLVTLVAPLVYFKRKKWL